MSDYNPDERVRQIINNRGGPMTGLEKDLIAQQQALR